MSPSAHSHKNAFYKGSAMTQTTLGRLTLPAVVVLIAFLSYGSQILFNTLEPHPLEARHKVVFNALIICIWVSYLRACFVDPGRVPLSSSEHQEIFDSRRTADIKPRWCRKCNTYKPPRAHHCKICSRCSIQSCQNSCIF